MLSHLKPGRYGWIALVALLCPLAVRADETKLNKLKQANKEDKLVTMLGELVVHAAHPTGQKVGYVKHELKDDPKKENRKNLTLKMEYFGKLTGKRYLSEIEIKIDTGKTGWEVIDIEYTDNNTIKPSLENIQAVKKKLNAPE